MSYDLSERIDDYCREQYDHSNWAYKSSDTKEFWAWELDNNKGYFYGDVFIWYDGTMGAVGEDDEGEYINNGKDNPHENCTFRDKSCSLCRAERGVAR